MDFFQKAKNLFKHLFIHHKDDDCTCHTGRCSCQDKDKEGSNFGKKGNTRS